MSKLEWTPSQGEIVWIKVFSNWSKGTYIGYDVIKNQHLVRGSEQGGGHLLISTDVLPENANPNEPKIDKKQSSIEWLEEQYYESEGKLTRHDFEQAKQMEKEQMKEAHLIADHYPRGYEFDKWYNETYGGTDE